MQGQLAVTSLVAARIMPKNFFCQSQAVPVICMGFLNNLTASTSVPAGMWPEGGYSLDIRKAVRWLGLYYGMATDGDM